eukprot:Seg8512.1 transcript_id=Seg8512.1/GoldUCD/mRNA.D3Y31 product="hypothetical protein" protein_id=Seg8512.1/GoldUCD/D3Y31
MDFGTENIYCEDLQVFFTNDDDSFRYGRSETKNRGILSRLKKFRFALVDSVADMFQLGLYKPYLPTHKESLLSLLCSVQRELNEFMANMECERVRQSASAPGGKANILFAMPRAFGYEESQVT